MVTIPQLIAILPKFLREKPHALTTETLAALDQILATLDNTSDTEIVKAMTQWFQSHSDDEGESLDGFVATNREISNQSAPPDNTEAEIRQNLFEACQVRQNQQENPPPPNDN
ncbi:MAG: hypothetical protein EA366_01820 [Spirulina sp. DLM2.Bin59]|nr:MAG: hypothetical protein EA366_01820 [Spirulina sp. DLM2.Bin59]